MSPIEETSGKIYSCLEYVLELMLLLDQQANYVFSKFNGQELTSLLKIIETATDTSLSFCSIDFQQTMNIFNN